MASSLDYEAEWLIGDDEAGDLCLDVFVDDFCWEPFFRDSFLFIYFRGLVVVRL